MHHCTLLHAKISTHTAINMLTIDQNLHACHHQHLLTYARRDSASPLSPGPPRDHGALHRHRHASATTLRLISLSPRGILQWPEEQSRSGCGQDSGDADQSQHTHTHTHTHTHRRMWRCRSSCPLLLARPSPRQPPCSQPPPPPRRSLV